MEAIVMALGWLVLAGVWLAAAWRLIPKLD